MLNDILIRKQLILPSSPSHIESTLNWLLVIVFKHSINDLDIPQGYSEFKNNSHLFAETNPLTPGNLRRWSVRRDEDSYREWSSFFILSGSGCFSLAVVGVLDVTLENTLEVSIIEPAELVCANASHFLLNSSYNL